MPGEQNRSLRELLDKVTISGATVPPLWKLEVGNALFFAERRQRITPTQRNEALNQLARLSISTDNDTAAHAWLSTFSLAQRFSLTLYDACYLELAQRRGLPLASLDRDLRAAGSALGIELLGLDA